MKTVVTHISVDIDAVSSAWIVKRYFPGWKEAELKFVPIETTLDNKPPDENPDIIHVDTGFGKFDHHHIKGYYSATKLVFEYAKENNYIPPKELEALQRVVDYVTLVDNFGEAHFTDPTSDLYDFLPHQLIYGIKFNLNQDDIKVMAEMFIILEAALFVMRNKTNAEKAISNGIIFQSKWGKTIAMESKNEEALKLALKKGFNLVIRKNPEKNFLKIKLLPQSTPHDLTELWEKLRSIDPKAHWGLHSSRNIITNGSALKPDAIPTFITLPQAIEIIKQM